MLLTLSNVIGIDIKCNFIFLTSPTEYGYNCRVDNQLKITQPNTTITKITGKHLKWTDDGDVDRLVFINNLKMSFIPVGYSEFFDNLNNIWIDGCPIESIANTDFENPQNIKILGIVKARLKMVDIDTFTGFDILESLFLQNNQIEKLHDESFTKLKNLKILKLSSNKLAFLPKKLFENCRNIQEIYVSDNKIKIIESEVFHGLTKITRIELKGNLCINKNFPEDFYSILSLLHVINENCGNPMKEIITKLSESKHIQELVVSKFQTENAEKDRTIKNIEDENMYLKNKNVKLEGSYKSVNSEKDRLFVEKTELLNEIAILRLNRSEMTDKIDEIINKTIAIEFNLTETTKNLKRNLELNQKLTNENQNLLDTFEFLELNVTLTAEEISDLNEKNFEILGNFNLTLDRFLELEENFITVSREKESYKVKIDELQDALNNVQVNAEHRTDKEVRNYKDNVVALILSGIIIALIAIIVLMSFFLERKKFSQTYSTYEASVAFKNDD